MAAIIPAVVLGAAIGEELPKFFNDAFDQLGSGEGIYLRDGQPTSLVVQVGQAVGRSYCRLYNSNSTSYDPGKAVRIEKACRPYLDSIGGAGGPGVVLPFQGGQCVGVTYNVLSTVETINPDGSTNVVFTDSETGLAGPISGIDIQSNGVSTPGGNAVVILHGAGQVRVVRTGVNRPQGTFRNAKITSITRPDGLPDNCGNPPLIPTLPPRQPDPTPPPIRFNPGPGTDISVGVDINPDATVTFDIGTGPITVELFPDNGGGGDGGGGDGGGGDGGGGDGPPGDVGDPGSPESTGPSGEAEGEAPSGSVLVGLRVLITGFPPSRNKYTADVFRGAYYAYMGVPGLLDLDPAGALARLDQFIFAEKDNLTSWRISANRGYDVTVTPYYREV